MDLTCQKSHGCYITRSEWRFKGLLIYILLVITQIKCQTRNETSRNESTTKHLNSLDIKLASTHCHNCIANRNKNETLEHKEDMNRESFVADFIATFDTLAKKDSLVNKTVVYFKNALDHLLDNALNKDRYVIIDGIELKSTNKKNADNRSDVEEAGRALFSKYTYEYRLYQKFKNFIDTHVLSINLPKAAKYIGVRSFGLSKIFVPLLIGGQILFKTVLFAMFLPSILGSFGKILGKGISQISSTSSQASYPPVNGNDQGEKDFMGYETNSAGSYAYPHEDLYANMAEQNEVSDPGNGDMSRFGPDGQHMHSSNSYYKNQMAANNYKEFQKIPQSSMILSNYDPFYSPLLSRLDGIFARLGLTPSEKPVDDAVHIGGQSLSDVKLEACREQLICLMYSTPAKYAPYSNLVSAQLSRELNELRRPVSDNPEILRFFRYMRAARKGQEGTDCMRAHPGCSTNTAPEHTMIAAYHDINKLVTARKLNN